MTNFNIRTIPEEELFTLTREQNAKALNKFYDYPVEITEGITVNELRQHQIYVQVILEGCSIEFGSLYICNLANCIGAHTRGYQIYCDTYKVKQDLIYNDVDEAVKEFLELKKRLSK